MTSTRPRVAVAAGATCIGINNRNLDTLVTDLGDVRPRAPGDTRRRPLHRGVRACAAPRMSRAWSTRERTRCLIGETLMRAASPAAACTAMVAAAREAPRARDRQGVRRAHARDRRGRTGCRRRLDRPDARAEELSVGGRRCGADSCASGRRPRGPDRRVRRAHRRRVRRGSVRGIASPASRCTETSTAAS